MRLLEMPADRLVVLAGGAGARRDPVGEPPVQLGARALQELAIGRVADQHVVEAQRRLAQIPGGIGLDELAAAQPVEAFLQRGARLAWQQRGEGGAGEAAPDHRRALEHGALLGAQALDARGEQRVDRRRHLQRVQRHPGRPAVALAFEGAVVHEHAHELADEEGIALAGGEHASGDGGGQLVGADDVRGEPRRGAGVEAGERHHLAHEAAGAGQRRPRLAQLGARGQQHQQRRIRAPLDEMLGEVEQQRLGPLHVVDRQHDRPPRREPGEEAADDEERLLRRGGSAGEQRGDAADDARALGVLAGQRRVDGGAHGVGAGAVVEPEMGAQRFGQRREGGAASGVAARVEHRGGVADAAPDLAHEPRLAEPGRAEHDGEAGAAGAHGSS